MKKILTFFCFLILITCSSCIQQSVEYGFDEYEIQTWDNFNKYNSVVYTNNINLLDSIKKLELKKAKKSIEKLRKLN